MAKLEKLTKAQEQLIPEIRDKWIKLALTTGSELDRDQAQSGIDWMYEMCGMESPTLIVVDSPLAAQYAANILKLESSIKSDKNLSVQVRAQVSAKVRAKVWAKVRAKVSDKVSAQVSAKVSAQVSAKVRAKVSDKVSAQVSAKVRAKVSDKVRAKVSDQVWVQVSNQNLEFFSWASECLAWGADDFSFYDFFYQIGVTSHEGLKKYLDYLQSGVFFAIFLEGVAIVSRRPTAIRRDQNHALDSDQLPAIEFQDGYKLWFLHGVAFEEPIWQKIISQDMTLPELAKLELGADQRAVAIQMLRPDRLLEQLGAKKIATGLKYSKLQDMYGEYYCAANFPWSLNSPTELYEVKNFMGTSRTEYCMKMEHPSIKDKFYIEWVEPEVGKKGDADLAQAHAFGMTVEEYFSASEA